MRAIELISLLDKGFIDNEKGQLVKFDNNNLRNLTEYFGKGYYWDGEFCAGYYYAYCQGCDDDPEIDEYDLRGVSTEKGGCVWYLYRLTKGDLQ